MTKFRTLFLLLIGLLSELIIYSQASGDKQEIYSWFDSEIGRENTGLLNGTEYIELHPIRNDKHKYFLSSRFLPGAVVYEGQPYFEVDMKYNVYDDVLLVRINRTGGEATLQLHREAIEGFSINGHKFLNVHEIGNTKVSGFYEVLLQSEQITLLKKHRKKQRKRLGNNSVYYEFEEEGAEYAFLQEGSYNSITSRRALQRLFPDHEREIRQYYRRQDALLESDRDLFMINLFRILNESKPVNYPPTE